MSKRRAFCAWGSPVPGKNLIPGILMYYTLILDPNKSHRVIRSVVQKYPWRKSHRLPKEMPQEEAEIA
jgi:hypothetical protein